jgi:hypothetical protein
MNLELLYRVANIVVAQQPATQKRKGEVFKDSSDSSTKSMNSTPFT